jgi:hypothetical protein
MIKPLRKRHFEIWMAMALLLPAGIILSWLVIPDPVPIKKVSSSNVELLPLIQAKKETLQYCINIRSNADKTNWQLEWKNRLPLTVPSVVIYKSISNPVSKSGFNPESAELIGRIEAKGDYLFPLKNDSTQNKELNLIIYDFIHGETVELITFKWTEP